MLKIIDEGEVREHRNKKNFSVRICCVCKSPETGKNFNGNPHWYNCTCNNIDCTGYLCSVCKARHYNDLPDSYININKLISNSRTCQLAVNSETGKGLIGEAVIAKVRKLEIISIKLNNFKSKFDLTRDVEHGMIQSKLRQLYYGDWITYIGTEHIFDTLFYICISKDMKDIERIYIIPQTELYGIQTVKIIRNPSSSKILKWDKYNVDPKPYNDAYHSLMEFLKDKKYFGIEDIKKWLNDGK